MMPNLYFQRKKFNANAYKYRTNDNAKINALINVCERRTFWLHKLISGLRNPDMILFYFSENCFIHIFTLLFFAKYWLHKSFRDFRISGSRFNFDCFYGKC